MKKIKGYPKKKNNYIYFDKIKTSTCEEKTEHLQINYVNLAF